MNFMYIMSAVWGVAGLLLASAHEPSTPSLTISAVFYVGARIVEAIEGKRR